MFKARVRLENPSYRIDDRDYRFQYRIASKEFPSPFPLEFSVFHLFFSFLPLLLLSDHVVPFLPLVSLPAIVSMGCREHEDCRVVLVVVVGVDQKFKFTSARKKRNLASVWIVD